MESERCLWKSPGKGLSTMSMVESSQKFEQKYGVNIFSNEVEKSESTTVRASDLEFSPEVQILFNSNNIAKYQSPVVVHKSGANTHSSTISPILINFDKMAENSISSGSLSSKAVSNLLSSPAVTSTSSSAEIPSYFAYSGVSFGAKNVLSKSGDLSPEGKAVKSGTSAMNPWILSDGEFCVDFVQCFCCA